MPVCSYLVHPQSGRREEVVDLLAAIPGCLPTPADAHDLIVLVTETENDGAEVALQASLAEVEGIENIALTFGNLNQTP